MADLGSKRIVVLGATGASGLAFIEQALALSLPPKIVAYARSPDKIPHDIQSQIQTVPGDLEDYDALTKAFTDADVVVSFLGVNPTLKAGLSRDTSTPIARAFPIVLKAMKAKGVKRLLSLSTFSYTLAGESWTYFQAFCQIFVHLLMPKARTEIIKLGDQITDSDIDWTLFRVPVLSSSKSQNAEVRAENLDSNTHFLALLSRTSMAQWILKEITENQWVRKAPVLSNPWTSAF